MKAWPIDPLAFRDLKLEVSEKLPQGLNGNIPTSPSSEPAAVVVPDLSLTASLGGSAIGELSFEATHLVAGNPRKANGTKRSWVTPRREGC